MPTVIHIFKNMYDCFGIPYIREFHFKRSCRQTALTVMDGRRINSALGEYSCDLRRTITFQTEWEYFLYNLCGFFIHNPLFFVAFVFLVAIRRAGTQVFPWIAFCFEHGADFLTCILCVPFVDDVTEGSKVAVVFKLIIHAVVDCYKVYVGFVEVNFTVITDL